MNIIQKFLNLFRTPWWREDEWAKVDERTVSYTKQKHDCPSWDVGFCNLERYKHKDRCEERIRKAKELTMFEATVFEDPAENEIECLRTDHKHISHFDVYDGPKYEEKN